VGLHYKRLKPGHTTQRHDNLYTPADWSKIYRYRLTEKKIVRVSDFKIVIVKRSFYHFRCGVDNLSYRYRCVV
jgi:hypothetical protein